MVTVYIEMVQTECIVDLFLQLRSDFSLGDAVEVVDLLLSEELYLVGNLRSAELSALKARLEVLQGHSADNCECAKCKEYDSHI